MASTTDLEKHPLLSPQSQSPTADHEPTLPELQENLRTAQRAYFKAWSRTTSGKLQKRIMLSVTAMLVFFMLFSLGVIAALDDDDLDDGYWGATPAKVPLEAHIMSKCPDAKDCLHSLILPAMQNVSEMVDFRLSYIGTVNDSDGGVLCQHGEEECLGNIIELCAAHLYPSDPKISLGFTMCLTRQYTDIPRHELVEDCALEHGISMEELNGCLDRDNGDFGLGMLKASFERSSEANVTKSCTIRLDGEERCIRDGGEWKQCEAGHSVEDLVADIVELYDAGRSQ